MKKEIPVQLYVGLGILLIGGALLGVEYFWVKLAPLHKQHVEEETLSRFPTTTTVSESTCRWRRGSSEKWKNLPEA